MAEALIHLVSGSQTAWASMLVGPERDLDCHVLKQVREDQHARLSPRIIRGQRCGTAKTLFREWAAALQFPYYFGNNWDALEECVNDLSWVPGDRHVIFVSNVHRVLPKSPQEFGTLIELLRHAAERREVAISSVQANTPLFVVFHAPRAAKDKVAERLHDAGVDPSGEVFQIDRTEPEE